jgi:hypothetical protein
MERTLQGIDRNSVAAMTEQLIEIKENVRQATLERAHTVTELEPHYG